MSATAISRVPRLAKDQPLVQARSTTTDAAPRSPTAVTAIITVLDGVQLKTWPARSQLEPTSAPWKKPFHDVRQASGEPSRAGSMSTPQVRTAPAASVVARPAPR